jgi:heat shock protein HtpX
MFQAVGLRTHIWNNNFRSLLLLAGFPLLLVLMVFAFVLFLIGAEVLDSTGSILGDLAAAFRIMVAAAPLSLAVAAVWFVIAYFSNQLIIDLSTGAKKVERADEPQLYNQLENLAISRGMKTPTLRIIDSETLNAFATGLHEGQYSITVTRGLMEALTPEEIEAVLAHELTHVINRDVRTMVIGAVFAGIISFIAQVIFRVLRFGGARRSGSSSKKGGGGFIILIALAIAALGYVLAIVIRMALSRSREFVADAGSVELTKNPDAMISALQKINGHSNLPSPEIVQGMFIDNVETGVFSIFSTHPPIAKRIEALSRYARGRVAMTVEGPAETGPWGEVTNPSESLPGG